MGYPDLKINYGVTCGPGYPLIRLQALRSWAGIRYYP